MQVPNPDMLDMLSQVESAIIAVDWLELIRTLAPVATAVVAYSALRNWRRQDKAKREAEFLDSLIDAAQAFAVEMRGPIELLRLARLGMICQVGDWEGESDNERALKGAVAYIEARGEKDGKRLAEVLGTVEGAVIRLRSLGSKGLIFGFPNYKACEEAILRLAWQYGRIGTFRTMIVSPTWNWDHPEVASLLKKVVEIDPKEVESAIVDDHLQLLDFARAAYSHLYG